MPTRDALPLLEAWLGALSTEGAAAASAALADQLLEGEVGLEHLEVEPLLERVLELEHLEVEPLLERVLKLEHLEVEPLLERVLEPLLERNQFLVVEDRVRRQLAVSLEQLLRGLREELASPAARSGRRDRVVARLLAGQAELARALEGLAAANLGAGFARSTQVSADYSAETQLLALHLDPAQLPPPILDLGCGRTAALVAHLRAAGKEALGLERLTTAAPHVLVGDWLEHDLGVARWGTVLSHLGFSLHFLHHHLRGGREPARYARRYLAILRALRPGGCFCYVPGLPFIEQHLSQGYRVKRYPTLGPPAAPGDPPLADDARVALGYAAHVTRL